MNTVILGTDTTTNKSVSLSPHAQQQGLYLLGKNGMGKSTVLLRLILHDISSNIGVLLIDPHGDLSLDILKRLDPEKAQKVFLVELRSDYPPGLNLFSCPDRTDAAKTSRAADNVVHIFKKLWGETSWGALMEDLLANLAYAFIDNPEMTLLEVPQFLSDEAFRNRLVDNVTNPIVRDYWLNEYNTMPRGSQLSITASTLRKIRHFIRNQLLYTVIGQSETTINLRQAMDEGWCLLLRLPMGELGEDVVQLIGALILDLVLQTAYSRSDIPEEKRRSFHLYCDEYHLFSTPATANLFTGTRKFGIATSVAHQVREQLDEVNRATALNAANIMLFQLTGKDSRELSGELVGKHGETVFAPPATLQYLRQHGHINTRAVALAMSLLNDVPPGQAEDINEYLYLRLSRKQQELPLTHAVLTYLRLVAAYEVIGAELGKGTKAAIEHWHREHCRIGYLMNQHYQRLLPPERELADLVCASWQKKELRFRRLWLASKVRWHLKKQWQTVVALAKILEQAPPTKTETLESSFLANLPPYHAYVKLRDEQTVIEHSVRLAQAPRIDQTPQRDTNLTVFRERSRLCFGHPEAEVRAKILQRQGDVSPPLMGQIARTPPPPARRTSVRRRVAVAPEPGEEAQ